MTLPMAILAAALTPTERFAALRPADAAAGPVDSATPWIVWAPLAVAAICGVAMVAWYVLQWARSQKVSQFITLSADRLGLANEERALLARIVAAAAVKDSTAIFTMEADFNKGLNAFVAGPQVSAMSEQARQHLTQIAASLRKKLGFPEGAEEQVARPAQNVPIPAGCRVRITMPACPDPVEALVVQAGEDEVVVQPPVPLQAPPGQMWRLQCASAGTGTALEFDAKVVAAMPTGVRLKIQGHPRTINHRRFVRAPTHKPVYLAPYSFVDKSGQGHLPEFTQGTLVEIGGPGLRIHSKVHAEPGDRMLVVVTLADKQVVRGMGTVRRCTPFWETVVEMNGLKDSELNALVRETLAALKQEGQSDEAAEKPSAPAAEPAPQPATEPQPQAAPLSTRN